MVTDSADGDKSSKLALWFHTFGSGACIDYELIRQAGRASMVMVELLKYKPPKSYFKPLYKLADAVGLPEATVRKHLERLEELGFVNRLGRTKSGSGGIRRCGEIQVTDHALAIKSKKFLLWPWWLNQCNSPWSHRCVFAFIGTRAYAWQVALAERSEPVHLYDVSVWPFTNDHIRRELNLSRPTISAAVKDAFRLGFLCRAEVASSCDRVPGTCFFRICNRTGAIIEIFPRGLSTRMRGE
jgi:DNA-binding Lrp family transcriptional regulator